MPVTPSPKTMLRTWLGVVVLTFLLLWVVAAAATPVTPWLQAAEGESQVLGLSPIGWSDVLIGTVTAGLFAGSALLVALARRAIWIPALVAFLVAPPLAERVAGTTYVIPHLAGHWNDLAFGRWELELSALLAVSWAGAVVELAIIALPATIVAVRTRPPVGLLGWSTVAVLIAGTLDVLLLDGNTVAPWGMVAGLAGIGSLAWAAAGTTVLWALAIAGPWGLLAATGAGRVLLPDRDPVES